MAEGNNRLRVAHIITQLELGGAQRNTLYTLGHLDSKRYEPILICGRWGLLDEETASAPWQTHFVRFLVRPVHPIKDVLAFVQLYQLLRQIRPHIVHTHSSKAGIIGRIAAYLAGVPVIVHTFHGFGFTPEQAKPVRQLFIGLEKFCARLSTHLIFVSRDNEEEAEKLGITGHVPHSLIRSGIYMGVEHRHTDPTTTLRKMGIPAGAWVVTSVGNFKPQKNPMDLARVAAEVLKQKPEAHFIFAGDGELREKVEAWCKEQQIEANVHFPGWCLRTQKGGFDVSQILSISKCFLLTSLWEGLPRALAEAAVAGVPAVAYAVNGVHDILVDGETGCPVPPHDIAAAAEKILWIKEHPAEAKRLAQNARARVEKEFDIDKMVRDQDDLYQKLYEAVPLKQYYEPLWNTPQ